MPYPNPVTVNSIKDAQDMAIAFKKIFKDIPLFNVFKKDNYYNEFIIHIAETKNYLDLNARDEDNNNTLREKPASDLKAALKKCERFFNAMIEYELSKDEEVKQQKMNEALLSLSSLNHNNGLQKTLDKYYAKYGYKEYLDEKIKFATNLISSIATLNDKANGLERDKELEPLVQEIYNHSDREKDYSNFMESYVNLCRDAGFENSEIDDVCLQSDQTLEEIDRKIKLYKSSEYIKGIQNEATLALENIRNELKPYKEKIEKAEKAFNDLSDWKHTLDLNNNDFVSYEQRVLAEELSISKTEKIVNEEKARNLSLQSRAQNLAAAKLKYAELTKPANNRKLINEHIKEKKELRALENAKTILKNMESNNSVDINELIGRVKKNKKQITYTEEEKKFLNDYLNVRTIILDNLKEDNNFKKIKSVFDSLENGKKNTVSDFALYEIGFSISDRIEILSERIKEKETVSGVIKEYFELYDIIEENKQIEDHLKNSNDFISEYEGKIKASKKNITYLTNRHNELEEKVLTKCAVKREPGKKYSFDELKKIIENKSDELKKTRDEAINNIEYKALSDKFEKTEDKLKEITGGKYAKDAIGNLEEERKNESPKNVVIKTLMNRRKAMIERYVEIRNRKISVRNYYKNLSSTSPSKVIAKRLSAIRERMFLVTKKDKKGDPLMSEPCSNFVRKLEQAINVLNDPEKNNDSKISILRELKGKSKEYLDAKKAQHYLPFFTSPQRHLRISCATEVYDYVLTAQNLLNENELYTKIADKFFDGDFDKVDIKSAGEIFDSEVISTSKNLQKDGNLNYKTDFNTYKRQRVLDNWNSVNNKKFDFLKI